MAGTARAEQPQLTTQQLQELLLPPLGWKVDKEVLNSYFWQIHPIGNGHTGEPDFIIYPFWPLFFEIVAENGQVKDSRPRTSYYSVGELLSDALKSPVPATQKKSARWLRQCLILYFVGIRLSKIGGQKPYAPWIKPEHARRLDQMADEYVSRQKMMRVGKEPTEITALSVVEWITHPRSTKLTDIVHYYDMLQASDASIAVDHIYPVRWMWSRSSGNLTLEAGTSINSDRLDAYAYELLPGTLPDDSTDPVSLWLRDALLAYIAGKELLEGKHLRLKATEEEPLLKDALQQWWAEVEKQQPQQ